MYKRFIKWNIAKDTRGEAVDVYEDSYGRLFIGSDFTFFSDDEFLALTGDVIVNAENWSTKPSRRIPFSEIEKVQAALRAHRAEYPMYS